VGLRTRLFLLLVIPMIAVIGGYGLLRVQQEEQQFLAEEQRRMAVTAKALQVAVENALRDRQISDIKRLLGEIVAFQEDIDRIRLFDVDLKPLVVSNPLGIGEHVPATGLRMAMAERQPVNFVQREKRELAFYAFVPLRDRSDRVRGAMEIVHLATGLEARLAAGRQDVFQRVGMLFVVLGVLVWVGVRHSVLRPIGRLMAGVQALAAGRPEPIPARGRDEFARLARAFNDMADRLAAAHRQLVAETEAGLDLARQLRQAEALVVAGRIASEVAHEIGTPLNVISGRAEYVLRELAPGDPRAPHLRTIVGQIDRISGIIASLLDVVRPRKAEIQATAVAPVLSSVVELLRPTARRSGLTLVLDVAPDTRVLADGNQLQQVAINLVMNAIEATPSGGRVVLAAHPAPEASAAPGAVLTVSDSGSGIGPEHLGRVFDPFFTTKPPGQGTGLGLAICRGIVREHGGTIEVESRVGAGTTFRIWLPAPPPDGPP
jgi:signal transduction histidine kinase